MNRFDVLPRPSVVHVVVLFAMIAAVFGTASPAAASSYPIVSIGHTGANVTTIQYLLRHRGYSVPPTGTFGSVTDGRVKAFQRAVGMTANGIVGPVTWSRLVVNMDYGARGDAVRALQVQLNKRGYSVAVDGTFGNTTRNAVIAFKRRAGINSFSAVGPLTWQALIGNRSVPASTAPAGGQYALPLPKQAVPRWRYERPHHDYPAMDLSVTPGTPVYAVRGGTVSYLGGTCGLGVAITANDGAVYHYCHLNRRPVAAGARVGTGQIIGYSGNTGNSTGPHLHLGIRYGGAYRCPQRMMLALYDGRAVPHPSSLPTSGCTFIPNW